jgi:hypothetical protein
MKVKLADGQSYEVYKVQRAMFSSDGITSYLIYNEARDEQLETRDPKLCKELHNLCKAPKFFMAGKLEKSLINFKEVLKGDDWF